MRERDQQTSFAPSPVIIQRAEYVLQESRLDGAGKVTETLLLNVAHEYQMHQISTEFGNRMTHRKWITGLHWDALASAALFSISSREYCSLTSSAVDICLLVLLLTMSLPTTQIVERASIGGRRSCFAHQWDGRTDGRKEGLRDHGDAAATSRSSLSRFLFPNLSSSVGPTDCDCWATERAAT